MTLAPAPTANQSRLTGPSAFHAVASLACLVVTAATVLSLSAPSTVRPETEGATFSAESAQAQLAAVATEPRPTGSRANQQVRRQLVDELEGLGLAIQQQGPQFSSATEHLSGSDVTSAAYTRNVVASHPGSGEPGAVVLLAHYDSTPNSPGASDNGYGVATTLETARALMASGPHRNRLVVVLSDAEEIGLLGAAALIDSQQLDPATTIVLNQEARGSRGATQLIRAHGDSTAARAVASAPRAQGGSEIASLFANATEFDEFAPAGFRVLDLANSGLSSRYDSGSDDMAGVSTTDLQQRGDLVLETARTLLADDLTEPWRAEESTWFTVPGALVVLPAGAVLWCWAVVLPVHGVKAVMAWRRRTGTGVPSMIRFVLSGVLVAVATTVSALAVMGWWQVLVLVRPAYGSFLFGDTPRPFWHQVTMVAIAALITATVHVAASRRLGPAAMVNGHVLIMTVLAALSSVLLPSGAHLFVLPAVAGGLLLLARTLSCRARVHDPFPAIYAVVVVVLLVPTADIASSGLGQAWLPAIAVSLITWPLMSVIVNSHPRIPRVVVCLLAVLVMMGGSLGLMTDRIEPKHPRHSSLALIQRADMPTGTWVSAADDPWATTFASGDPGMSDLAPDPLLGLHRPVRTGTGPTVNRPPPALTRVEAGTAGTTTVVVDPAGADRIALHLDGPGRILAIDGHQLDAPARPAPRHFVHLTTDPDRRRHRLTISARPDQPLTLHALGLHTGLEHVHGYRPPSAHTTWSPGVLNNVTAVESTLRL